MDRGNGRVEDQPTFDLRQIEREQLGGTQLGSAWERAQADRENQVEQLRLKSQREQIRQQRIERESDALATQRRQWQSILSRENAAGGAVIDRAALDAIERHYQAAMSAAVFPIVMAKHYGGDPATALRVVLGTSLVGLVTIPLWLRVGMKFVGLE